MRVTQLMLQRTLLTDTNRVRLALARTQEQAASGLRVNRPSDDPVAASRAVALRADLESVAQLGRNLVNAETRLGGADQRLQDSVDVLVRARELAVQGANDTLDPEARRLVAAEVASLHGTLLSASNANSGGAHIFAGYASDTAPFTVSGSFVSGSPPPSVSFVGDSNEVEIEIGEALRIPAGFDGRRVFLGDADGNGSPDAGREDVFQVLAELWQGLENDDQAAIGAALGRIDVAQEQLQVERTTAGTRLTRIESARQILARRELDVQTQLSETQDADSVEVYSNLVRQETALQASLQATARVLQPTLLDFLS